jgi:hypothetical protein
VRRAVLKSGSLNILEPSGPVQACNGVALHLPLSEVRSGENICLLTGATDSTLSLTRDPRNKITTSGKQLVNSGEMCLSLELDSIYLTD